MLGMGYALGRQRALAIAGLTGRQMHSLPEHHGAFVAVCASIPAFGVLVLAGWLSTGPGSLPVLAGAVGVGALGAWLAWRSIQPAMRARTRVESLFQLLLALCSSVAIVTTIGIIVSVLFEAVRFFQSVPVSDFLFGLTWSPQTALRTDQVGASGSFGAVPLFAGTVLISGIALAVGAPLGLF